MSETIYSGAACPSCSRPLKAAAKFCGGCGNKVVGISSPSLQSTPSPSSFSTTGASISERASKPASFGGRLSPIALVEGAKSGDPIALAILAGSAVALVLFLSVAGFFLLRSIHGASPTAKAAALPPGTTLFPTPVTQTLPSGAAALNVHVRSGPGTIFPAVEVLERGATITEVGRAVDGEGKAWIAIRRSDGSYGFIKERLLSAPSAAAPASVIDFTINQAMISTDVQHGRPAADVRVFAGPAASLGIYIDYTNAHKGDVERSGIFQNGKEITSCNDYVIPVEVLKGQTASAWCQIGRLSSGQYDFVVHVNGTQIGAYPVKVT